AAYGVATVLVVALSVAIVLAVRLPAARALAFRTLNPLLSREPPSILQRVLSLTIVVTLRVLQVPMRTSIAHESRLSMASPSLRDPATPSKLETSSACTDDFRE